MAPSHVDLSVLWVPIMPETSKLGEQMEQVGQDATESFAKGSTGLGDKIHESVTKSRDKIKDVFHRTGSDAGKSMSDAFKEETKAVEETAGESGKKARGKFRESVGDIGKELVGAIGPDVKRELGNRLEDVVGGAVKGVFGDEGIGKVIGESLGTAANSGLSSWIGNLQGKLKDTKAAADTTRKAFADFGSGDTVGGVSKLVDGMGKLGITTKDLPPPLQDAITKLNEAKQTTQQFSDIFKDMPGKIGLVGTAIADLAGPLAVALAAQKDIDALIRKDGLDPNAKGDTAKQQYQDAFSRIHRDANGNIVVDPKAPKPPGIDMGGVGGIGKGGDVLGSSSDAYDFFSSGKNLDDGTHPAAPAVPTVAPPVASPVPSAGNLPSSFTSRMPSVGSPSDLHRAGGNIANLYRVANALQGTPYSQALRNDCSGMVSKLATAALGMEPSVQFATPNEGDWLASHGFQPGHGPEGSFRVGWNPQPGNAGHTAATLPGGEHAESGGAHGNFLVGAGAAGADDPQFSQHAWLPMNGSAAGGMKTPAGTEHDPLYVSHASGGAGGGGSDAESQGQQLGSGMVNGLLQEMGLDGSVFKTFGGSSNPLHFGVTKLATGLVNTFAGGASGGDGASSGGGIPGLGMLGGLIPGAAKGVVPTGPGGSQSVRTGETTIHNGPVSYGPQLTVNQQGVQSPTEDLHAAANGAAGNRLPAYTAPNAGPLPSTP